MPFFILKNCPTSIIVELLILTLDLKNSPCEKKLNLKSRVQLGKSDIFWPVTKAWVLKFPKQMQVRASLRNKNSDAPANCKMRRSCVHYKLQSASFLRCLRGWLTTGWANALQMAALASLFPIDRPQGPRRPTRGPVRTERSAGQAVGCRHSAADGSCCKMCSRWPARVFRSTTRFLPPDTRFRHKCRQCRP